MHALREYRLKNNSEQKDFAKQIGWSVTALSSVENGHLRPGDRLVARLANALSLPLIDAAALARNEVKDEELEICDHCGEECDRMTRLRDGRTTENVCDECLPLFLEESYICGDCGGNGCRSCNGRGDLPKYEIIG